VHRAVGGDGAGERGAQERPCRRHEFVGVIFVRVELRAGDLVEVGAAAECGAPW